MHQQTALVRGRGTDQDSEAWARKSPFAFSPAHFIIINISFWRILVKPLISNICQKKIPDQIVVDLSPGAGEKAKGLLRAHGFGVLICATTAHKAFVKENLQAFVKDARLVNLTSSPPKPPELLDYERKKNRATPERPVGTLPKAPSPVVPKAPGAPEPVREPVPEPTPKAPTPALKNFGSMVL